MWLYQKKLEYPVRIKNPNPRLAKFIISQYGGPDGEIGAALRYISQRISMPDEKSMTSLQGYCLMDISQRNGRSSLAC